LHKVLEAYSLIGVPWGAARTPEHSNMPHHVKQHHAHCPDTTTVEYVQAIINCVVNLGFLWGSVLFLKSSKGQWYSLGLNNYLVGDILFIVCSIIVGIICGKALYETMDEKGELMEHMMNRVERNEIFESALFVIAAIIFTIGSIIYYPYWDFGSPENKEWWESWGACSFIAGSFCFVLAGFFNGYGKSQFDHTMSTKREFPTYILKKYGLLCVVLGSVFFVVGSYLYRPGFHKGCNSEMANGAEGKNEGICADSMNVGTWQYIYGSIFFSIDACFQFACLILRHQEHNDGAITDDDSVDHEG